MKKLRIALIANTGLGNEVLKKLIMDERVEVDSLCTRKLEGRFPYYEENEIEQDAREHNIICLTNVPVNEDYYNFLKIRKIDFIFVASFHQILKHNIIELPRYGVINFHPSLLPKYRGPSPLNWVILNDEKETGVTAHLLTTRVDAGNVLANCAFSISGQETLQSLFKKSAVHSGELVSKVLDILENDVYARGEEQNESIATYFKRPSIENRILNNRMSFESAYRIIRAFHPYPGALIDLQDSKVRVINFSLEHRVGYGIFLFDSKAIYLQTEAIE